MKKTTLTIILCAALVLSACNITPHDDNVTESTVNINDAMNNPDSIPNSEISELIDAYLAFEAITEQASDSMNVDYDQSYTDGLNYYHKVTDERYDTWEEWSAYVGSIFTGDYLTRILNTKEVFINVDGYTYWQSGAMGWYIEDDYTYETSDISSDKMTLRIIRTESVPEEEENIITTNFELCMTDGVWRICGLAAPKDTFKANIIENIIYHSDRVGKAQALEDFYSDDTYTYSFPTIRSDVVIVYYNDGTEQTVKDALAEGKIKISDLDRFGIKYNKKPIDYSHWYTFEYDGAKYDLSEIYPAVNGVWEGPHIGKYVIAVGHINPDNSGYAVINTETQKIDHHFAGGAFTYHSDDINTIVYAFWEQIVAYDGTVLATVELAEREYIRELKYTEDFQKINVTIANEDGDRTVIIDSLPHDTEIDLDVIYDEYIFEYSFYPMSLINHVGNEAFTLWLANSEPYTIDETNNIIPRNIVNCLKYFNITQDELEKLYYTNDYYSLIYDLDIMYNGTREEICRYFKDFEKRDAEHESRINILDNKIHFRRNISKWTNDENVIKKYNEIPITAWTFADIIYYANIPRAEVEAVLGSTETYDAITGKAKFNCYDIDQIFDTVSKMTGLNVMSQSYEIKQADVNYCKNVIEWENRLIKTST